MVELFQTIRVQIAQATPLEWAATITGFISVYYFVKNRVAAYPWGILNVLLYAYFFYFIAKLYSDALLQVYFLLIQIYGWWLWTRRDENQKSELPISLLPNSARLGWGLATFVLALLLGYLMKTYTDASLPYADAAAAAVSIVAQYFLTRRILENWILWIGVDIFYVFYIYPTKGYYLTTLLYALFTLLAIKGYREWLQLYRQERMAEAMQPNSEKI